MKIDRLFLKAYGPFANRWLDFTGGPDFHVIYGPNEAGKSTTLRALKGLLFGIDERTADNFIHPNQQLRIGATLLSSDGSSLSLMRRKGRKQTLFALDDGSGEELTDRPFSEEVLVHMLGGLDEGLFQALFGLDLEGLERGGEALLAGKGEVGESLFEAAAGLASLQKLMDSLEAEASERFRPRGTTSRINAALKQLEEKRRLARETTVRTYAWEQAERAKRQAEAKHETVRHELKALREEHRRLSRVKANLPLATERAGKLLELEGLTDVPLLPPEAKTERIETMERLRAALKSQREAQEHLDELRAKRSPIAVREALLEHAATIERLHVEAKNYREALDRWPRLQVDIEASRREVSEQLSVIDPGLDTAGEPSQARALLPDPTVLARLQSLEKEQAENSATAEQLAEQDYRLAESIRHHRTELDALPAVRQLDPLDLAREEAATRGDIAGRLSKLDREIAEAENLLAREAQSLWDGSLDDLVRLRVPLSTTVSEIESEYRRLAEEERLCREKDNDLQRDIGVQERELAALTAAGEVATPDQVLGARRVRDDGWSLIRQTYIDRVLNPDQIPLAHSPGPALPTDYEAAVRAADRLADLLHADAERAANFEIAGQRITEMLEARLIQAQQLEELNAERQRLDSRWAVTAEPFHQPGLSGAAALEWLQKHGLLIERFNQLDSLRRAREESLQELSQTRAKLSQAFRVCGRPDLTEDEPLSAAIARAKRAVEQVLATETARKNLSERLAEAEGEFHILTARRAKLAGREQTWQENWTSILTLLRLPPQAMPAEARSRLEQIDRLAKTLERWEKLGEQARQEKHLQSTFERQMVDLAQAVAEPAGGKDADVVVIALYGALDEARQAQLLLRETDAGIEREERQLTEAKREGVFHQEHLGELIRRAGTRSAEELPLIEERSARKRQLAERVTEIEGQLMQSAGRPLTEVLAEVEDESLVSQVALLDELDNAIRERETETERAYEQFIEERRAFEAIDGSDLAAQALQEAEEIVAHLAHETHTYARLKLAGAVVSRVVQAYRERHQGPVLRRAGEIFSQITLGSFRGLVTDYEDDRQILLGQRQDGSRVGMAGQSQGTRDQLFLALRIAAIEEHLRQREPVPVVVDDLLVQFDDDRAAKTLAVLAALAERTQVLFFTHHRHLCEIATASLSNGAWRLHELQLS